MKAIETITCKTNVTKSFKTLALVFSVTAISTVTKPVMAGEPTDITAAGDSITMAFAAICKKNRYFWDLFCLLGTDRPKYSWFDGSNNDVDSVLKRYQSSNGQIDGNKSAAKSGSELRGGDNNFSIQAEKIVENNIRPDHVEVILGGNDICNRECVDPANCDNPLYTGEQWRESLKAGLDILVEGLPEGSTIYLGSVPRVQDLRAAGLQKQEKNSGVRCESIWSTFDICTIATKGGDFNGESVEQRYEAIEQAQIRYNQILREEALKYNANEDNVNPRNIEVISEYIDQDTQSIGTYAFDDTLINGGDCFHPNVDGQNLIAEFMWSANLDR